MINLLDYEELARIKRELELPVQREARSRLGEIISDNNKYKGGLVQGLSFPLEVTNGSLKISSNSDRIYEQIQEVLETRLGERIMRQFFGIPDLIFESFSEDILRNTIIKQIKESLSVSEIEYDVDVKLSEEGTAVILIGWKLNGIRDSRTLKYTVV